MKRWFFVLLGVLVCYHPSKSFGLEDPERDFISQSIDEINLEIQNASSSDCDKISVVINVDFCDRLSA